MYLGIDTHTEYSQVAVVDDDGNLQDEIRLPNDRLGELAKQYAGGEAAIEASGHYRPVYEMLDEHLDVTLVNPSKNRIIADATVKTDRIDAKRLAHMLRADMLAESYVPSDEIRTLRDLVRTRKSLVEERTAEKPRQSCPQAHRQRLRQRVVRSHRSRVHSGTLSQPYRPNDRRGSSLRD